MEKIFNVVFTHKEKKFQERISHFTMFLFALDCMVWKRNYQTGSTLKHYKEDENKQLFSFCLQLQGGGLILRVVGMSF